MIELRGIAKRYESSAVGVDALRGVDLDVPPGQFLAIVGPSGSGKSTLLHILGLLDVAYAGEYRLDGRLVSTLSDDERARVRNRQLGFVFQNFCLLSRLTILDNVALPALYVGTMPEATCRDRAARLLAEVGLGDRLGHRPSELSAGQRQRTAIARALVNEPRVLLADEPTGALDSGTTQEILEVLLALHQRGVAIILITHDGGVASIAERIVHVLDGRIPDGRLDAGP